MELGVKSGQQKDHAIYVGLDNPTDRLAVQGMHNDEKVEKRRKEQKEDLTAEGSQQNKAPRGVDDGLLLVVAAQDQRTFSPSTNR